MMKVLKKLLISLFALLLFTTIAIWALAKTISPEVVKTYVSTQLTNLTQQESKIEGEISWHIFPHPGIKITKIRIGTEGNQTAYAARLDNLHFNLKITPLLGGKLVFDELNIDGFNIHINPEIFSPTIKRIKYEDHETKAGIANQFAIERFLLSHGQVVIQKNQKLITLSGLQIGAEHFNVQQTAFPLQLKTNIDITETQEKLFKTHLNFKGNAGLSSSFFSNPLLALQNTPLDGQLMLQNTRLKQFKITKICARTKTKPGVLLLNPLTFNLYNGESVGDLHYEFASKKLILNQTATNLDSAKLIDALFHKTLFRGNIDFSLHAQANLQQSHWLDQLTGNGSLTIKDGILEAINLDKVIEETSNKINSLIALNHTDVQHLLELGQFNNPEFFKGGTRFKLLSLQYRVQNSILDSNSVVLQTDKLQLKGESSLNLQDERFNSHLLVKVVLQDSQIDKIQQLLGGYFPILISGTLTAPIVLPDLQKINPLISKIWLVNNLTDPVKRISNTLKTIITTATPELP